MLSDPVKRLQPRKHFAERRYRTDKEQKLRKQSGGQEQLHGEVHEGCLERLGVRCVPSITQACATDSLWLRTGAGFRCC